jgi:serpin B
MAPLEPLVSAEQVNSWCSNKTHGKIKEILDDLSEDTIMIILNAVYFKGEWILQFNEELTKKLPFYNLGKIETNVETMTQIEYFNYYEDKKVQAIELRFVKD